MSAVVSTEYPRRGRAAAASAEDLPGISASWPRRRRDPAEGLPGISTSWPRRRPGSAEDLPGISTSWPRRRRDPVEDLPGTTHVNRYVMSFDSHTNYAKGWDSIVVDVFKRIDNPRAIITTYPASYSATRTSEKWQDVDHVGKCDACRRKDDQERVDVDVTPEYGGRADIVSIGPGFATYFKRTA